MIDTTEQLFKLTERFSQILLLTNDYCEITTAVIPDVTDHSL